MRTPGWIALIALCGCAGPTSPFGALTGFEPQVQPLRDRPQESTVPVEFSPQRKIYHKPYEFEVNLKDRHRASGSEIQIIYNGKDLSDRWKAGDEQGQFSLDHLYLDPSKDHEISVRYKSARDGSLRDVLVDEPDCARFSKDKLGSVKPFKPPGKYLNLIETHSKQMGYNPNLLAALIAQESSFYSKAVSWSKALGLTQVTWVATQEISDLYPDWPVFEPMKAMHMYEVKRLLRKGQLTSQHDWRLDPDKSIQGGLAYLKFLEGYWSLEEKIELIEQAGMDPKKDRLDLILASYNSGAARVSYALKRRGEAWYSSRRLNEARIYFRKVKSYCDEFHSKVARRTL